jgi:hypothetical protein
MSTDPGGTPARLLKLWLIAAYLGAIGLIGARLGARRAALGVVDIGLIGLASHRVGRIVAFERVAVPIREPFTATVPDSTGVDETVVARGRGVQWAVGELLSCPTCVASWAALMMYIGMALVPGPTRVLISVLSAAGVAELVHNSVERLEWTARAARVRAG